MKLARISGGEINHVSVKIRAAAMVCQTHVAERGGGAASRENPAQQGNARCTGMALHVSCFPLRQTFSGRIAK